MITVIMLGIFSSAANVSAAPGGNGNGDNKENKGKSSEAKDNKGKSSENKDKNVNSSDDNKGKGKSSENKDKNVNSSDDNKGKGKSSEAKENKGKSRNSNQGHSNKVTICHIPPGNPENRHTISVGFSALPAHFRHGDTEGPCDDGNGGGGSNNSATLTVIKVVDGGTAVPSDFTLTITGVTATGGNSVTGTASPGITKTTTLGPYGVTEPPATGYSTTYSTDCNGTLADGDAKTCTVTNTFTGENSDSATLTVIKVVDGGTAVPSDFEMTITGVIVTGGNSFDGAESPGTTRVTTLGDYTVTESVINGYTPSYSTDCNGTLADGESKTCTVTNTFTGDVEISLTLRSFH